MLVIGELPKDYEYFYEKITTFQEINVSEETKEELIQEEIQPEVVVEETQKKRVQKKKLQDQKQQLKDSEDKYLRVHADFENIKKRLERENTKLLIMQVRNLQKIYQLLLIHLKWL